MKILVLSDIHLRKNVAQAIIDAHSKVDQIVCLGDCFDNWNDTVQENLDMAIWVKEKLDDSKYTFLVSNHDGAYLYPENKYMHCSGYTEEKKDAIRSIISSTDVEKFKFAHFSEEIIFSHAGFDRYLFNYISSLKENVKMNGKSKLCFFGSSIGAINYNSIQKWMQENHEEMIINLRRDKYLPLFGIGRSRNGSQEVGGITWQDEGSHLVIRGVNQIFGHSIRKEPLFQFINTDKTPMYKVAQTNTTFDSKWFQKGFSLCLDTNSRDFVIIENGNLNLYKCQYIFNRDKNHRITGCEVVGVDVQPYKTIQYK